jgi:cell division initiation protein
MKITPLDIQQQEFKRAFLGLEAREVRNFLDLCRDTVEALVRENASLRDEAERREAEVARFRERERVLQETLLTAQRMSDDMRQSAHKEAEIILAQAQLEGEKIVHNAQNRLLKLFEQIHELRRQKAQFETGLKRLLDWHQKLIDIAGESERELLPDLAGAELAAVEVLDDAREVMEIVDVAPHRAMG